MSAQSTLMQGFAYYPISVLSVPGTVCDGVTDVSSAVNTLNAAGVQNIILPKNCVYFTDILPAGIRLFGEDPGDNPSGPYSAIMPVTYNRNIDAGSDVTVERVADMGQFCTAAVQPKNVPKACRTGRFNYAGDATLTGGFHTWNAEYGGKLGQTVTAPYRKIKFTASVGGATSGTLYTPTVIQTTTGDGSACPCSYGATFSDGEQRLISVNGTAVTWSGALSAGSITTATVDDLTFTTNIGNTSSFIIGSPYTLLTNPGNLPNWTLTFDEGGGITETRSDIALFTFKSTGSSIAGTCPNTGSCQLTVGTVTSGTVATGQSLTGGNLTQGSATTGCNIGSNVSGSGSGSVWVVTGTGCAVTASTTIYGQGTKGGVGVVGFFSAGSTITGCPGACVLTVGTGAHSQGVGEIVSGQTIAGTGIGSPCTINANTSTGSIGAGSTWSLTGAGCANVSAEEIDGTWTLANRTIYGATVVSTDLPQQSWTCTATGDCTFVGVGPVVNGQEDARRITVDAYGTQKTGANASTAIGDYVFLASNSSGYGVRGYFIKDNNDGSQAPGSQCAICIQRLGNTTAVQGQGTSIYEFDDNAAQTTGNTRSVNYFQFNNQASGNIFDVNHGTAAAASGYSGAYSGVVLDADMNQLGTIPFTGKFLNFINNGTNCGTANCGYWDSTNSITLPGQLNLTGGGGLGLVNWNCGSNTLAGNFTTNGACWTSTASTVTETGTGTITVEAMFKLPAVTVNSNNGTPPSVTRLDTLYLPAPVCGTGGVTCSATYSLEAVGGIFSAGNNVLNSSTVNGSLNTFNGPTRIVPGTTQSQATWGTQGAGFYIQAGTFNDTTTGSAGVTTDVAHSIGAPTFTNTQGTANVLTNATNLYITTPICGSGWASCTNLYSLWSLGDMRVDGAIRPTNRIEAGGTKFTLGTVTGACATNSTPTGGATAGSFKCTGTTGASTAVVNLPAGKAGYACFANDDTAKTPLGVGANSTTTVTISGTVNTNDVITFGCIAF